MPKKKSSTYRGKPAEPGFDWMFTNYKYAVKFKKVRNKDTGVKETCKAYKILDSLAMTCIFVYNQAREYCQNHYKQFKQLPSNTQIDAVIREYAAIEENKQYFQYMSSQTLQQVRDHLKKAYKAFYERRAEAKKYKRRLRNKKGKLKFLPKFKSIFKSRFSICYPQRKTESYRGGWDFANRNHTALTLPKLVMKEESENKKKSNSKSPVKIYFIKHRPMTGEPVSITFTKDVDRWYVTFTTRKQVKKFKFKNKVDTKTISLDKIGGMDVGVTHLGTLDTGETIESVNYDDLTKKIKALQRKMSRQQYKRVYENEEEKETRTAFYRIQSSKSREKTKLKIKKLWRRIRNKRLNDLYHHAKFLLDKYDILFVEDLRIQNMTASAKGTVENPGKNVKAKTRLNRSIRAKCWGMLFRILEYKFRRARKIFERVYAPNTSRRCSVCGYIQKENRYKEHFKCLADNCDHEMNADHNAAINIRDRGILYYMPQELKRFGLTKLLYKTYKNGERKKMEFEKKEFSVAV